MTRSSRSLLGNGKYVDVIDMRLRDVVKALMPQAGDLLVESSASQVPANKIEPIVYALTRQQIEIKSQAARAEIVDQPQDGKGKPYRIGVIELPSFYAAAPGKDAGEIKSATEDVRRLLKEFKSSGVDGVILDMRNNPGGFLSEAVALAGLFIDQGPVVQVKGVGAKVKRLDASRYPALIYDGP